jgi:hypothetical protein
MRRLFTWRVVNGFAHGARLEYADNEVERRARAQHEVGQDRRLRSTGSAANPSDPRRCRTLLDRPGPLDRGQPVRVRSIRRNKSERCVRPAAASDSTRSGA